MAHSPVTLRRGQEEQIPRGKGQGQCQFGMAEKLWYKLQFLCQLTVVISDRDNYGPVLSCWALITGYLKSRVLAVNKIIFLWTFSIWQPLNGVHEVAVELWLKGLPHCKVTVEMFTDFMWMSSVIILKRWKQIIACESAVWWPFQCLHGGSVAL